MDNSIQLDLNRLPDSSPDRYNDADLDEAIRDNADVNDDIRKSQIKRFNGETSLRENLSTAFTVIIIFWLLSVILILVGNFSNYKLSDNVLITLMVTSSANVIGMMQIILKNLFPNRDNDNNL